MASLAGLFRSLLLNPLYLLSSRVTALIHTLYDVCSKIIPYPWRILGHMQRQDQDLEKNVDAASKEDVSQKPSKPVSYITVPGQWANADTPMPIPQPGQIIYVTKGHFLAWGGTAILERLPTGDVVKTPKPHPDFHDDHCRNMRIEAEVYEHLGDNPRVPKLISWDPDTCCLIMEYLENGDLATYIQEHGHGSTDELRLRWALQAAEGIAALHSIGVIHCDISPRNFLLGHDLDLKVADFGGVSISGSEPSAVAGTRFRYPQVDWNLPPQFDDDIFSLGSLIYFVITGNYPYSDKDSDEVEVLYASESFPDVSNLTCGLIISQCWARNVQASEVCSELRKLLEAGSS